MMMLRSHVDKAKVVTLGVTKKEETIVVGIILTKGIPHGPSHVTMTS